MLLFLIAVGFISILGQVVILRELSVAFYGIELIYTLSIGIWLIGTSVGASLGRRKSIPKETSIQVLFFISAFLLIADVIFIRLIQILFQGIPGGYLSFYKQILAMLIALIPFSTIMGLLFQWTARRFISLNGTLAKAYSIESLGGILGGLTSTLFLYAGLQNFSIAVICSITSLGVITYFSLKNSFNSSENIYSLCLLLFIIFLFFSPLADRWMTKWNYPSLVESKDTPFNRLIITSLENQISVFEDGALCYETESSSAEEFIQISTLHVEKLDKVLVLGNGFGGIITELLKLPVKKIDYVELNKELINVLKHRMPNKAIEELKDEKVNLIYRDPRDYLREGNLYNAIVVCMPEPSSAQSNRFYTQEFFRQCSYRMVSDAILVFKIPSSENLWTSHLVARNKSIYNALHSVFSNIIVLPGTENIFIASKEPLNSNPAPLISRFNERKPSAKLVTPDYIKYVYTNDRFSEIREILTRKDNSERNNINSDIRPACYSYTLSIWLSKFFHSKITGPEGYLIVVEDFFGSEILWLSALVITMLILIIRSSKLHRFILVTLFGLIGMIAEAILILNYQSKNGVLYRDIGILLMTFMAGLSLGAYIVNNLLTSQKIHTKKRYMLGILLILGFAVMNLMIYYLIKFNIMDGLVITSALMIIDGFFVSAIFSFASLSGHLNKHGDMLSLYSADLIGGCLGSVTASLIFIPIYGMLITSLFMAGLAIFSLIFLWGL
ncbi:MAG: hypothetical protein Q8940_11040 [Bacteroidota bacterium]|nr:hypothetical protein [Bacteroidota bacterium]